MSDEQTLAELQSQLMVYQNHLDNLWVEDGVYFLIFGIGMTAGRHSPMLLVIIHIARLIFVGGGIERQTQIFRRRAPIRR